MSDPDGFSAGVAAIACQRCGGSDLSIHPGRHGYFFRCTPCQINTPIRLGCGHAGHNDRLRKVDRKFFRECAECGTSVLFFENPADLSALPPRP